jgi:hypothetical protein
MLLSKCARICARLPSTGEYSELAVSSDCSDIATTYLTEVKTALFRTDSEVKYCLVSQTHDEQVDQITAIQPIKHP